MELKKRKYKRKDVIAMIEECQCRYDELIKEQKIKISELEKANNMLQAEVDKYREKEQLVFLTLSRAEKNALDIKEAAKEEYQLEVDRLRKFSKRWEEFFNKLNEANPDYNLIKTAVDINNKIHAVSNNNIKEDIDQIEAMLPFDNVVDFNPKQKISDYIVATEDTGFNINEVLHPGELELEKLCKELGLMDEES